MGGIFGKKLLHISQGPSPLLRSFRRSAATKDTDPRRVSDLDKGLRGTRSGVTFSGKRVNREDKISSFAGVTA